jgi:hypothetical protein
MSAWDSEFFQVGGLFTYKPEVYKYGFRIDNFLRVAKEPRWDISDPEQAMLAECLGEQNDIVTRWYWCAPEDATHVSGSSVCGVVARVEDITMTGMVTWSEELLSQVRKEAASWVGRLSWDLTSAGVKE